MSELNLVLCRKQQWVKREEATVQDIILVSVDRKVGESAPGVYIYV
jgi:hypothetical protein